MPLPAPSTPAGPKSVARRVLRGCAQALGSPEAGRAFAVAQEEGELRAAAEQHAGELPQGLPQMCDLVLQPADDFEVGQGAVSWIGAGPCSHAALCTSVFAS